MSVNSRSGLEAPRLPGRIRVRERVAASLRTAIAGGDMRPGLTYSAPALAERLGVSATPVREAMLQLAREGLVDTVANKGFRVREASGVTLGEIVELRRLVEVPTVTRVAAQITPAQVRRLRALAEPAVAAAHAGDLAGWLEADRQFHLALLELVGNAVLLELAEQWYRLARHHASTETSPAAMMSATEEQRSQLLDALAAHDCARVQTLMLNRVGSGAAPEDGTTPTHRL